jgi:hypothetical protein
MRPAASDRFCALEPRHRSTQFRIGEVLSPGEQISGKPSRQKETSRDCHKRCSCEDDHPRNMMIPKTITIYEVRSATQYIDRQRGADQRLRKPGAVICLCWKHARDLIQYDD